MAQHTAPLKKKSSLKHLSGIRPRTPIDCVGCKGPKEKRKYLFCKKCRLGFLAAKKREAELDEAFEYAIAS